MILIAFQDVRPVILTVFDNIAFFSSLSSILIFWHVFKDLCCRFSANIHYFTAGEGENMPCIFTESRRRI
jgi:hypothetical protein